SGTGSHALSIGQNRNTNTPWPVARLKTYTQQIDFDAGRSYVQLVQLRDESEESLNEYITADSPWSSQFGFWLTPFGFIKGALANNATVSSGKIGVTPYTIVTFSVQNKYKVVGYIDDKNFVYRVETWVDSDVFGDMLIEATFNDYKDFDGG